MLTIVLSQSFISEICNILSNNWMSREELVKTFNQTLVDAFLNDFNDYLTEGKDGEVKVFTLGLGEDESEYLKQEILATNQKRLELKY